MRQRKDGRYEKKVRDPITGKRVSVYADSPEAFGPKLDRSTMWGYFETAYWPSLALRSDNWRTQVLWAMGSYIGPEFGHRKMQEITRRDVQSFFNHLSSLTVKGKRKLQPSSIGKIKIVLSAVLNMAVLDEVITRNPAQKVNLERSEPKARPIPTMEQFASVYHRSPERIQKALLLMGCLGLRVGEACGLKQSDLGKEANIHQQVLQPSGGSHITSKLKTQQSNRVIPVPKGLGELLSSDTQYVASNAKGGYMTPNNISRELAKITAFTPHDFRHMFITLHAILGTPDVITARLAGKAHTGKLSAYQHAQDQEMKRAMERFWNRISPYLTTKPDDNMV